MFTQGLRLGEEDGGGVGGEWMGGRGAELKKEGEDEEVKESEREGRELASQPCFLLF